MGMAAGAKATGSTDDEGSPVSRPIASSMGDRRRSSGLMRRVSPETVQRVANNWSWRRTHIRLIVSGAGILGIKKGVSSISSDRPGGGLDSSEDNDHLSHGFEEVLGEIF